jgi:hypothetical protein
MYRTGTIRFALSAGAALALACGPVTAQQIQVVIDRSLTDDPPYTAIYPEVMQTADDGNPQTILTLRHPDAPLQCDVLVLPEAPEGWTADGALATFDAARVEAAWSPTFPGFRVTGQSVTRFASGPALLYEGTSDGSPFNVPVATVHAEAVENGRTYAVTCLAAIDVVAQARPVVDFIIANFSTNSEGQCCIDPADDRG